MLILALLVSAVFLFAFIISKNSSHKEDDYKMPTPEEELAELRQMSERRNRLPKAKSKSTNVISSVGNQHSYSAPNVRLMNAKSEFLRDVRIMQESVSLVNNSTSLETVSSRYDTLMNVLQRLMTYTSEELNTFNTHFPVPLKKTYESLQENKALIFCQAIDRAYEQCKADALSLSTNKGYEGRINRFFQKSLAISNLPQEAKEYLIELSHNPSISNSDKMNANAEFTIERENDDANHHEEHAESSFFNTYSQQILDEFWLHINAINEMRVTGMTSDDIDSLYAHALNVIKNLPEAFALFRESQPHFDDETTFHLIAIQKAIEQCMRFGKWEDASELIRIGEQTQELDRSFIATQKLLCSTRKEACEEICKNLKCFGNAKKKKDVLNDLPLVDREAALWAMRFYKGIQSFKDGSTYYVAYDKQFFKEAQ